MNLEPQINDRTFHSNFGKRIAIVVDSMNGGGAERVCLDLSRNFIRKGCIVDLLLCEFHGNLLDQIPVEVNLFILEEEQHRKGYEDHCSIPNDKINWIVPTNSIQFSDHLKYVTLCWPIGIKLNSNTKRHKRIFPIRSYKRVRWSHAFAVYLRENRPDLVLANLWYSVFCTLVGRDISAISVPVICSIHNAQISSIPRKRKLNCKLLSKADWVHTVSNGIKKELSELNWFDDKKITTVYNSLDKQRVCELAKQRSGHPWLDRKVRLNHKVILAVGRLASQKNHPLLIRSFANIAQSAGNIKLIILGEGRGREDLQSLIVKLGLAHIVSLPGWIANPFPLLCQTDVFVLSSYFEGLPIILIEALACGCNIVSTDCTHGPREILDHGKFGELVPVDDELAMTEAISRSLNSNPNREALVARALEFSPDRQMANFEQMIAQVIDSTNKVQSSLHHVS